jgi:hypothetical protein
MEHPTSNIEHPTSKGGARLHQATLGGILNAERGMRSGGGGFKAAEGIDSGVAKGFNQRR